MGRSSIQKNTKKRGSDPKKGLIYNVVPPIIELDYGSYHLPVLKDWLNFIWSTHFKMPPKTKFDIALGGLAPLGNLTIKLTWSS